MEVVGVPLPLLSNKKYIWSANLPNLAAILNSYWAAAVV